MAFEKGRPKTGGIKKGYRRKEGVAVNLRVWVTESTLDALNAQPGTLNENAAKALNEFFHGEDPTPPEQ